MNIANTICAPTCCEEHWHSINWSKCYKAVKRLQARIAKAIQEGRWNKARALQWLLTHSFYAKVLAIRRVTENRGKSTAGVDGEKWSTPKTKSEAIVRLKRRGYQPKPVRRVYIPKAKGKRRPLGIPCMADRAMKSLYLLGLEPIAETKADRNSYGFRSERSTADAIRQCFNLLCRHISAQWVLEGDIKSCFDEISHIWLEDHIPMDKTILRKWLKAGFIDKESFHPTSEGVPQGSPISPVLTNMTLDGLEELLSKNFKVKGINKKTFSPKVNMVRFADDFVVTGHSKEILEQEVKPLIEKFLKERGLSLSQSKTKITHIGEGFDFLGQNLRKYQGKLIIKPSRANIHTFLAKIRRLIKLHQQSTQADLIETLNPVIRGWANYHRHVCSKLTFTSVDHIIWQMLWHWATRRHSNKSSYWVKDKYFHKIGKENWVFATYVEDTTKEDGKRLIRLGKTSKTSIRRHIKIKADANPYDPAWETYFEARLKRKMTQTLQGRKTLLHLWHSQNGKCLICNQAISKESGWHVHHILEKAKGGSDAWSNLVILHPNCHSQVHSQGLSVVKPIPTL